MSAAASVLSIDNRVVSPPQPRTIADTGLSADAIEQLLIKTLYGSEATGLTIAERMRLPFSLLEPAIERVRAERQIEVKGATGSGSVSYRYALSDLGRERARQYLDVCQYIGPAPVPLEAYVAEMQALSKALREHFAA